MDSVYLDTVYVITNDSGAMSYAIPLGSMFIALVAVIVGPIVAWKTARKQTLLPMRLQWIEQVRDLVSEFLTCIHVFVAKAKLEETAKVDAWSTLETLMQKRNRIELLLNPQEESHKKLLAELYQITDRLSDLRDNDLEVFLKQLTDVLESTNLVLRAEWSRVKDWSH